MENNYIKNFKNLKIWQKANSLEQEIEVIVRKFPYYENSKLSDQLIRSIRSIGANIAEGNTQLFVKKEINYISNALGSTGESRSHIVTAYQNQYITIEEYNQLDEKLIELVKMLYGYLKILQKESNSKSSTAE